MLAGTAQTRRIFKVSGTILNDKDIQIFRQPLTPAFKPAGRQLPLTPSWLSRQPKSVTLSLLRQMFSFDASELSKSDAIAKALEFLCFVDAANSIKAKKLLCFDDDEIKIVSDMLNAIDEAVSVRLFNYFHSDNGYSDSITFLAAVDAMSEHDQYDIAVSGIFDDLKSMLVRTKRAAKFEDAYCIYYREKYIEYESSECMGECEKVLCESEEEKDQQSSSEEEEIDFSELYERLQQQNVQTVLHDVVYECAEEVSEVDLDIELSVDELASHSSKHLWSLHSVFMDAHIELEFGFCFQLISSIFVDAIKELFIHSLALIVRELALPRRHECDENNVIVEHEAASFAGAAVCTLLKTFYSRHIKVETRNAHVPIIKRLLATQDEREHIPKEIRYENDGFMYLFTPQLYPMVSSLLSALLTSMNVTLRSGTMHRLPDFGALIKKYIQCECFVRAFRARFDDAELEQSEDIIQKIWFHFVKSLCNKLIWSVLKQQDWAKADMSLRDKFKYQHMQHVQRVLGRAN